jgi:hypothetical protein
MQPTAGLLWSGAVGHLSHCGTRMYVTAGGRGLALVGA